MSFHTDIERIRLELESEVGLQLAKHRETLRNDDRGRRLVLAALQRVLPEVLGNTAWRAWAGCGPPDQLLYGLEVGARQLLLTGWLSEPELRNYYPYHLPGVHRIGRAWAMAVDPPLEGEPPAGWLEAHDRESETALSFEYSAAEIRIHLLEELEDLLDGSRPSAALCAQVDELLDEHMDLMIIYRYRDEPFARLYQTALIRVQTARALLVSGQTAAAGAELRNLFYWCNSQLSQAES